MSWVEDVAAGASVEAREVLIKHKDVLVDAGKVEFQRVFSNYYMGELTTFDSGILALERLAGRVAEERAARDALLEAVKEIGLTVGLFVLGRIV